MCVHNNFICMGYNFATKMFITNNDIRMDYYWVKKIDLYTILTEK